MKRLFRRRVFILLCTMVLFSGCRSELLEPQPGFEQPFWLGFSESTVLLPDGLRITFDDVPEDSRCAADVVCVWEGRARGRFGLEHDSFEKAEIDLILSGYVSEEDTLRQVSTDTLGYVFTFMQLDPYPRHDSPHEQSDYRALLRVDKGESTE